jgi:hypothetical protein
MERRVSTVTGRVIDRRSASAGGAWMAVAAPVRQRQQAIRGIGERSESKR